MLNLIKPLREHDGAKAEFILPFLDTLTEENRFTQGGQDLKHVNNIYKNVMNWVFNIKDEDFYPDLMKFIEEEFDRIENPDLKWAITHVIFE